jgi:hypothetical protein
MFFSSHALPVRAGMGALESCSTQDGLCQVEGIEGTCKGGTVVCTMESKRIERDEEVELSSEEMVG